MKKLFKMAVSVLATSVLCTSLFVFNVFAAASTSIAFSVSSPKVGDSVTVTVKLSADEPIYSIEGTVTYDATVLQYVSGASTANGSTLRLVDSFDGKTSVSYNLIFKTITEGTSKISFSAKYVGQSLSKTPASGSSANLVVKNNVTVSQNNTSSKKPTTSTAYVKSSNADLSSLSVSGAVLSPEFSKNVTDYSATVENSVATAQIVAAKANKKATVTGAGEVALAVGENSFAVTVTAEDGTKKTYNIKIKRATIEETVALNPLATVIGGKMHHIVPDLSAVGVPTGFMLSSATYNGVEVPVFKNEDSSIILYQISRDEDKYTDYYRYIDYRDEFVKLDYMTVNNEMYIFSNLPDGFKVPEGYFEANATLGGSSVKAFCAENELLKDFYVIYCFANGGYGFYSFDTLQSSIQRFPDFGIVAEKVPEGLKGILLSLTPLEKYLSLATILAAVIIVVLNISLAVSIKRNKKYKRFSISPITDEDMNNYFTNLDIVEKHDATATNTENNE